MSAGNTSSLPNATQLITQLPIPQGVLTAFGKLISGAPNPFNNNGEGFIPFVYDDDKGVPTIGYGVALINPATGQALPQSEVAQRLLNNGVNPDLIYVPGQTSYTDSFTALYAALTQQAQIELDIGTAPLGKNGALVPVQIPTVINLMTGVFPVLISGVYEISNESPAILG